MLTKIVKSTPLGFNTLRAFASHNNSHWGDLTAAPVDPIFGVNMAFQADKAPNKQLLGVGAYRTNEGKPYILPCVTEAEKRILAMNMDHEYSNIDGNASFREKASGLVFAQENIKRVANIQTISGTGGLRVGFDFLREWFPNKQAKIFVPDPTWPTHRGIATKAGFEW